MHDTTETGKSVVASVIIPTYNRFDRLPMCLDALAVQTFPVGAFEVIVVDDGSTDGTPAIAQRVYPFRLRYVRQANQGDGAARNTGAQHSQAGLLIFLDDDIIVEPDYVAELVRAHDLGDRIIAFGNCLTVVDDNSSHFLRLTTAHPVEPAGRQPACEIVPFTECLSGVMSVRRQDYLALGMMQPLLRKGSDIWADIDFSYRAHTQGFRFHRVLGAVGHHHDAASRDLATASRRGAMAAQRAVLLSQKYPDILQHLPMFSDKTPVHWRQDPAWLIVRKLARRLAASQPAVRVMEGATTLLERRFPSPALLRPLYRWIIGSYIFRGYRLGLKEYGHR
jgi:glycosyltransferase involved in cell wall biosynthesis